MVKSFAIGLPVFLLLDALWLGFISNRFYATQLGPWLRKSSDGAMAPYWTPALLFYVLVVAGIAAFVVPRVVAGGGSLAAALGWGALFGVVVYSAWDLTNYSVFRDWPLAVTVADMAWGAMVCALTTVAITVGTRWLGSAGA